MNKLEFIVVMIKLFLGGMQFVAIKMMGQTIVRDMDGNTVKFKASFFVALVLFTSVMFAFVPYIYLRKKNPKEVSGIGRKSAMRVGLSGSCDAVAQICTILSLGMIPASLLMVLKGSRAVFSAVLSIVMLKRNLRSYQWTSLALCMGGLGVASIGQFLSGQTPSGNLGFGIAMVLLAEAFRSVRMVYDERLMRVYKYSPFMIVSMEGATGTIVATIAIIIVNFLPSEKGVGGVYESFENTMYMIGGSPAMIALIVTFPIWVNSMYLSGIYVTKLISAVYNAVVTVLTVAVVWAVELALYYGSDGVYGDQWTIYSLMQIGGFLLILLSTVMYDATLKIPRLFDYTPVLSQSVVDVKKPINSTVGEASVKA